MSQHLRKPQGIPVLSGCIALILLIVAAGCAASGKATDRAPDRPLFAGTWEGTFEAEGIQGWMRLVLNTEEDSYSGTVEVDVEGELVSGSVFDFSSEGNALSFKTSFDEIGVAYKGTIEGESMTGTLEAFMQGQYVAGGTFSLKKIK